MTTQQIVQQGKNCGYIAQASRASVLIDGESYYTAFYQAVQQARKAVYILAWDIDSRMQLIRGDTPADLPVELGDFLNAVVKQRPELNIYILNWDWAVLYSLEREWMPTFRAGWKNQKRLRYELDDKCPFGGSQHQKIVVIDDKLAFCGGIDLGKHRWDSSNHAADEPRRIDPDGERYPPFHDMMVMVEGEVAKVLGDIARARWHAAMKETLPIPDSDSGDIWPASVPADFEQVDIALSRTMPEYQQRAEIREIEAFYLDAIAAAKSCIYIENQYFSSHKITDALIARLAEPEGPEIIVICPKQTGGWLEQHTMDILRQRVSYRLCEADKYDHLRICYAHLAALGERYISLHSKMMIVDDVLLHIGSANLSNRSMGLDSECDLTIEALTQQQKQRVTNIKYRLLGEHLEMTAQQLETELSQQNSVIKLIDARQENPRTLRLLDCSLDTFTDDLLPTSDYVDPERPVDSLTMSRKLVPIDEPTSAKKQIISAAIVLGVILLLTAVWKWTPVNDWLHPENLRRWIAMLNESPFTPLIVIGGFAIAGALAVPLSLLVVTMALSFGVWPGSFYALSGAVLSAVINYYIGQKIGRKTVVKMAGSRLNKLSQRLANHGVMATITVRLIPVAPFTVINLVAGTTHIKLRDFVIGTFIGLLPGILMITIFAKSLVEVLVNPNILEIAIFIAVLVGIIAILWGLKKWLETLTNKRG